MVGLSDGISRQRKHFHAILSMFVQIPLLNAMNTKASFAQETFFSDSVIMKLMRPWFTDAKEVNGLCLFCIAGHAIPIKKNGVVLNFYSMSQEMVEPFIKIIVLYKHQIWDKCTLGSPLLEKHICHKKVHDFKIIYTLTGHIIWHTIPTAH